MVIVLIGFTIASRHLTNEVKIVQQQNKKAYATGTSIANKAQGQRLGQYPLKPLGWEHILYVNSLVNPVIYILSHSAPQSRISKISKSIPKTSEGFFEPRAE